MNPTIESALSLNLPEGRGVNFPPPALSLDAYMDWLEERHQERVRQGTVYARLGDPRHCPVDAPFRLD